MLSYGCPSFCQYLLSYFWFGKVDDEHYRSDEWDLEWLFNDSVDRQYALSSSKVCASELQEDLQLDG